MFRPNQRIITTRGKIGVVNRITDISIEDCDMSNYIGYHFDERDVDFENETITIRKGYDERVVSFQELKVITECKYEVSFDDNKLVKMSDGSLRDFSIGKEYPIFTRENGEKILIVSNNNRYLPKGKILTGKIDIIVSK